MIGAITSRTRAQARRPPDGPVCLNTDSPQAVGLVAFWPLHGRSAQAYRDYAGRGAFPLTEVGTMPVLPGPGEAWATSNTAVTTNYLTVTGLPATAAPFTVGLWFYATSTTTDQALWSATDSGGNQLFIVWAGLTTAALSASVNANSSMVSATSGAVFAVNTWTHGCAVFASSTSRAAYLNGGNKGTETTSRTPTGIDRCHLGTYEAGGSFNTPLNGRLSHVCVWNVAKSDQDVVEMYDPATRWELYYTLGKRVYFLPPAPPAVGGHVGAMMRMGVGR